MEKEKLFYHYIYQEMISCINYFHKKENLRKMGLNERQIKSVIYVKEKGKITNKEYQELNKTTKKTASRDLSDLVEKGILEQIGETGKGTHYTLIIKRDTKGTKET